MGDFCSGRLSPFTPPAWILTNIEPAVDPFAVVFRKPAPDSVGLPSPNGVVGALDAYCALHADELGGALAAPSSRSALILGVKK